MQKGVKAIYHLPGLFEFYEFYRRFLPLYREHREYFYEWCEIGSIYGAPSRCLWGGGRIENEEADAGQVLALLNEYQISARLTFSNSLLEEEHLIDRTCNELCAFFEREGIVPAGVIVHSERLLAYLKKTYPALYTVSSTTKVITDFRALIEELNRPEFRYVVPDFRLNPEMKQWELLTDVQKDKVEFLCNECCYFGCADRKACYENVSKRILFPDCEEHVCKAPGAEKGYVFSTAMQNRGFISRNDIIERFLPMGFTNFKIEGRSLGNALILEFLLYYMTKPAYQLQVREAMYLDHSLDLF